RPRTLDSGTGDCPLASGRTDFVGAAAILGVSLTITGAHRSILSSPTRRSSALTSTGHLDLGNSTVTGSLVARSNGGAIEQSGALGVDGTSTLDARTGDITLAIAGNDFGGAVDIIGGAVTITDANALTLGTVTAAQLAATSTGRLDLGNSTVPGSLVARSNGGTAEESGRG